MLCVGKVTWVEWGMTFFLVYFLNEQPYTNKTNETKDGALIQNAALAMKINVLKLG